MPLLIVVPFTRLRFGVMCLLHSHLDKAKTLYAGHVDAVNYLVHECKVDLNALDSNGDTAAHDVRNTTHITTTLLTTRKISHKQTQGCTFWACRCSAHIGEGRRAHAHSQQATTQVCERGDCVAV
jgi:hypothetical protein